MKEVREKRVGCIRFNLEGIERGLREILDFLCHDQRCTDLYRRSENMTILWVIVHCRNQ